MFRMQDTPEEWRNVFYVSAAFYICGIIIYGCLVSGEIQPWALDKEKQSDKSVEIAVLPNDHKL